MHKITLIFVLLLFSSLAKASPSVKVDSKTQQQRDLIRKTILENELKKERALLEKSKLRLNVETHNPSVTKAILRHQKAILAIERELNSKKSSSAIRPFVLKAKVVSDQNRNKGWDVYAR